MTLRPATPVELSLIVEWQQDPDTAPWLGDTGRGRVDRALHDLTQAVLIATNAGDVVGFVWLARLDEDEMQLRRIVISPQRRGQGLGHQLLDAALVHAQQRADVDGVWLDVRRDNERARNLYAAAGFELVHSLGEQRPNLDGSASDLVILRRPRLLDAGRCQLGACQRAHRRPQCRGCGAGPETGS